MWVDHARHCVPLSGAVVRTLKSGDFFGALACLTPPGDATVKLVTTVRALERTNIVCFASADVRAVFERHPDILEEMRAVARAGAGLGGRRAGESRGSHRLRSPRLSVVPSPSGRFRSRAEVARAAGKQVHRLASSEKPCPNELLEGKEGEDEGGGGGGGGAPSTAAVVV